ncbi:EF-hand domain-containing protein 1-like [Lingula anatina]|uniref:EF-hand domain-containing protein 1 n=1 Tax=Lingula anatina TaxID=7574 RepID=A0A1S3K0U8_LINAN|nr:EF-hand domain-containing protein 1 [Lingula anatina]XP_013416004.1 EF-hand domain-containing protein 1-like [Lingula anatina]|eukprot:XP_013383143.1 EF-hand domain-containing protein 1 [Lingula anatina]
MEGLPFLPGNSFSDPAKSRYHLPHTLGYQNGYALQKRPELGVGGVPLPKNQLSEEELDELANFKPTLTYGQAKQAPPSDFVPAHVAWDKKVLLFRGYFKQTVHESPGEYFRVRPVNIYYYLEDDSISVVEPHVENSGMPQGKLIKRQRLPKNDQGDNWHWKDINLGQNITFYGKVFHITDCDQWTRDFLDSEGIVVNEPEQLPLDPYTEERRVRAELRTYETPSSFDKLKQFLELDRKVLRFFCAWDDRDSMFGQMRPFILHYYLVDDTLEIREVREPNDGRDPFPVLIGRHKVPKDRYNVESSFPGVVMELTNNEIKEYFTPRDFMIGETVYIYGRRFLIYDCDNFTKAFFYQNFGISDFPTVDVKGRAKDVPKMEIPPYNQFGSLEDSLQSCLSLIPQPPKKDFIKMLENDHKVLRFEAILDSVKPEDKGRRFILSYRLADDMMTIYEPPVRNSGIIGGKFLERTRVAKPNSTPDRPVYYGPADLCLGSTIEVFKHRFVITNADEYVLKYMEEHSSQFPETTINSLRATLGKGASAQETVKGGDMRVKRAPGDLENLVREVKAQLKKIAITGRQRIDDLFLKYDTDRSGYIDKDKLKYICKQIQLPLDDDVMDALVAQCTRDAEGKISLEDFRTFFEST